MGSHLSIFITCAAAVFGSASPGKELAVADKSIKVGHFDRVDNFLFSSDEAGGKIASLTHFRDEKEGN